MSHIIHLITSYVNRQKNYLDSKPIIFYNKSYACISFTYYGIDIEVYVYNDNFIKLKVDNIPYAICDSVKTFRDEIDRLNISRYQ